MTMTAQQALEPIAQHRGERIVITTMTAVGLWPALSDTPLDFNYIPSAMGHGIALGIGLALAQPERGVIVIHGDGSTLMNLGSLVTLAHTQANVHVVILANDLYEVTGGQPTGGVGHVDFAAMAKASGIDQSCTFETLETWQQSAHEKLSQQGPSCLVLGVEGRLGQKTPAPPRPMHEQIARLSSVMTSH